MKLWKRLFRKKEVLLPDGPNVEVIKHEDGTHEKVVRIGIAEEKNTGRRGVNSG